MLCDSNLPRRASRFTLQWHLTHACELHCLHCYDRSKLVAPKVEEAFGVLDQMEAFCAHHDVVGSVCLSGGNPFLYKPFFEVYEEVVRRGFRVGILANPVDDETLDRLVAIRKPGYFQVSLEGLEPHNDYIRGSGFFKRVMDFLPRLRERGIQSVVMTTLTRDNAADVIPLSRLLQGRVDRYTYNRLAQVGEGATLAHPDKETYGRFMIDWLREGMDNKGLGYKDNLFNIYRHELGQKLFGGCTGYGCGQAFNFVALLPDGDVHACRKYPSRLGNIYESSLIDIYASDLAERYRRGCTDCDGCAIRHRCGGCPAVTYGYGIDPFVERDPHCFMDD